ncbi:hypothetical protein LCGC14_2206210 [marine sediment metagenome]|uniref:Uncharacterized protein n=1 Tax=marine sediment metagenome TaxID=412755 RepID=A0A0F9GB34_9ZZZZ
MTDKDLLELIKNDPGSVKDLLREIVSEEADKRETEKQTACNHRISATLIDPKNGIIRCDECSLVFDLKMAESFKSDSADAEQLPPMMQKQIESLKQRKADADS